MKKLRKFHKKSLAGFTLIELLVVVAIIGLLSSVVLISLNSARSKARDAKRLADVRQIASALELYYNDCGGYPVFGASTAVALDSTKALYSGTITGGVCGGTIGSPASGTTYLGQFPVAPTPADTISGAAASGLTDCAHTSFAASGGSIVQPTGFNAITTVPTYNGNATPSWGASYIYTGTATTYQVTFCLGALTGGSAAGKHILTQSGIN